MDDPNSTLTCNFLKSQGVYGHVCTNVPDHPGDWFRGSRFGVNQGIKREKYKFVPFEHTPIQNEYYVPPLSKPIIINNIKDYPHRPDRFTWINYLEPFQCKSSIFVILLLVLLKILL